MLNRSQLTILLFALPALTGAICLLGGNVVAGLPLLGAALGTLGAMLVAQQQGKL